MNRSTNLALSFETSIFSFSFFPEWMRANYFIIKHSLNEVKFLTKSPGRPYGARFQE
jgi:hypothetical protein